eukprot:TRINITY_DN8638_c2_g2_i1.p1 TRINITY_DN8638_c2_g2~~TRINITY_DN8638_c2_g2_i1.p1  ORF type:complete len:754 (-),score=155.28 TRINITY_DN8638_c2_g2_i1:83-2344(-)
MSTAGSAHCALRFEALLEQLRLVHLSELTEAAAAGATGNVPDERFLNERFPPRTVEEKSARRRPRKPTLNLDDISNLRRAELAAERAQATGAAASAQPAPKSASVQASPVAPAAVTLAVASSENHSSAPQTPVSPIAKATPWCESEAGLKELQKRNVSERSQQEFVSTDSQTFFLHRAWMTHSHDGNATPTPRKKKLYRKRSSSSSLSADGARLQRASPGSRWRFTRCVALPDALWRLCWDIAGMIFIGWDVVYIPMQVFEIPEEGFLNIMNWFLTFYWTLDIILTFFVGYYDKGVLVMKKTKIARHYLCTWFLVDTLVVGGDWFGKATEIAGSADGVGGLDTTRVGRITRVIRAVRVLRLLRLLKLKRLIAEIQEHIYTEYAFILLTVLKSVIFIIVCNHLVACTWYLIGTSGSSGTNEERRTWVEHNLNEFSSISYRYTTSLHWSLTQFTPASMEVNPRNSTERAFAVVVLIIALVTFSSFVSNITNSMTSLRNMTSDDSKQLWLLRRFLRHHKVPVPLIHRLTTFLEYTCRCQRSVVQERDIRILNLLSDPLRNELYYHINFNHVSGHPLFRFLCSEMEVFMHRLCAVMRTYYLAAEDIIFHESETAHKMYFFINGNVDYLGSDGVVLEPPLAPSEWLCEAALWTQWRHCGELSVIAESEFVDIDADAFAKGVSKSVNFWKCISVYAERFVAHLNNNAEAASSDVLRDEMFYGSINFDWITRGAEEKSDAMDETGDGLSTIIRRFSPKPW